MDIRDRLDNWRVVAIFGIVYAISQAFILYIIHPLRPDVFLALQLSFSKNFYVETFHRWMSEGLFPYYEQHFYLDFVHPLWYGLFLSSFLICLFKSMHFSRKANLLLVLPIAASISDFAENAIQIYILQQKSVESVAAMLIVISATASWMKWTFAALSVALILMLMLFRTFKKPLKENIPDEASHFPA